MKAAVYSRYGPPDVVQIRDIEKPVPRDNEVVVRIQATTVCAAGLEAQKGRPIPYQVHDRPLETKKVHTLGMEFAGPLSAWARP